MNLNDANRIHDAAPDDAECIFSMQKEALGLIMNMTDEQIYRLLLTIKEVG